MRDAANAVAWDEAIDLTKYLGLVPILSGPILPISPTSPLTIS